MTTILQEGDPAPDFSRPATGGAALSLGDFRGRTLVLYFYPKDDTPGCTKEACSFSEALKDFKNMDSAVLGVSKDGMKAHDSFSAKYGLAFPLLSDEDGSMCAAYGVWIEKSMYGRRYMGIDRSTFLIDGDGIVRRIWRGVKVPGHVEDVREAVAALAAG